MAWERAIDDALAHLLLQHPDNVTAYIFEMHRSGNRWSMQKKLTHLSCFLPGNIALGVMVGAVSVRRWSACACTCQPPHNREQSRMRTPLQRTS